MKKLYLLLTLLLFTAYQSNAQYGALDFDGTDDYVSFATPINFPSTTSSYTLEAWIKPDAMGTKGIIGWGTYGTNNAVNALRLTDTGLLNYWWGNDYQVTTGSLVGAWHHVAVVSGFNYRAFYLDGNLVASAAATTTLSHTVPSPTNFTIGRTNGTEYFDGKIYGVRVWRTERSQAQIQEGMYTTYPDYTTNMSASYDFNYSSGTVLPSIVNPSFNNGTLQNFALTGTTSNWTIPTTAKVMVGMTAYTTLKQAFDAINAGTHTGAIKIGIVGDTTETASPSLNGSGTGAASYTSITISPAGGTGRTITLQNTAVISLNGADNVTINGLNSNGNSLTILSSGSGAIKINGGSNDNSIFACNLLGASSPEVVLLLNADTADIANTTINGCNIAGYSTSFPQNGIKLQTGTPKITGTVILNNNISDYFIANTISSGIYITGKSYNTTIRTNRFYQSESRNILAGSQYGIYVVESTADNNYPGSTIASNRIGYYNTSLDGVYNLTGSTFAGISFNGLEGNNQSVIQDNTIAAISLNATANAGVQFSGITVSRGNVSVTGNTIGSMTGTGSITVTGSGTATVTVTGIGKTSYGSSYITNNSIGGLTMTGNSISARGIDINANDVVSSECSYNTIGGDIANSINTTGAANVAGISMNNNGPLSYNTVRNITSSGAGYIRGISCPATISSFNGNIANQISVTNNTVYNLSNTNTTAATVINGIYYTDPNGYWPYAAGNKIHSFFSASNDASSQIFGINYYGQHFVIQNNTVALGTGVSKSINIYGIYAFTTTGGGASDFRNNSVYIGGTQTTGASESIAIASTGNVQQSDVYTNNILVNNRSNSGGTGAHASIKANWQYTLPKSAKNIFYGTGSGYLLGYLNTTAKNTLADWQANVTNISSSFFSDPKFIGPTATIPDLHINPNVPTVAEGLGVDTELEKDIDGDTRSGLTPHDIGSDAGNFTAVPLPTITSLSATSACTGSTVDVTGTNFSQVTAAYIGSTLVTITNLTATTATLAVGNAIISGTITLVNPAYSVSGTQTFNVYNPQITGQPQAAVLCGGGTTTFSVTATNALTYQWRRNGVNITDGAPYSGATSATLTITNGSYTLDGSSFDCIVAAGACIRTSAAATLKVNIPPAPVIQAANTVLCNGDAALLSTAHSSNALQFDGVNDYFVINRDIAGDFTIEFWIKTASAGAGATQWYNGAGLVDGEISGVAADFGLSLMGGKIAFGVGGLGGGGDQTIFSATSVNTDSWIHIAATRVKATGLCKLYINGVEEASMTANTFDLANPVLNIGKVITGTNYFNGSMDDLRIWTTPRTQAQIRSGMLRSMPADTPSLPDNFLFNQGSGTVVLNTSTSTGNSLSGSPAWTTRNNIPLYGTYSWSNGATTPEITTSTAGNYSVTVTDADGCSATSPAKTITQTIVTINVTPLAPAICLGTSTTLTASGASTYTWSPATGLSATTGTSVTANPTATTTYTVTGTAANGCTNTKTVTVTVNTSSPLNISGNNAICLGSGTSLTASGASTYTWSPATGLSATTGATVTANPTVTTTYTVTGTNSFGCTSIVQVTITVNSLPVFTVSDPVTLCSGGQTTLTATGDYTYAWSPSAGLSATTGLSVTANPTVTTIYTVTGTNSNGCTSIKTVQVTVIATPNPVITASATGICQGNSATLTATNIESSPALQLNGDTYFTVPRRIADDFTIEFWMKSTQTAPIAGSWYQGIGIVDTEVAGPADDFGVALCGGKIAFGIGKHSGGTDWTMFSTTTVNTGQWVHVAVTRVKASGQFSIYINGQLETQYNGTNLNSLDDSSTITIGRIQNSANYYNGAIDDIRIWNVVRSPEDILNNIYTKFGTGTANLATHFDLNEGGGNTLQGTGTYGDGAFVSLNGWVSRIRQLPMASILWSTGATTSQITVAQSGNYTATVTTANGCSATSQPVAITVYNPLVSISPASATICSGIGQVLTASGATTYTWSPATGLSTTTGATVTANPTATTTYTVTGTDVNGCIATKQVTITVNTPLPVTISGATSICTGGQTGLTASGSQSYSWSPATGLSATTGASVTASPVATTTYTVTATDANGCVVIKTVTITVNDYPNAVINAPVTTFCPGGSAVLTAENSVSGPALVLNNGTNFVIPRTVANSFTIEFWIKTTDPGPSASAWHLGQGIVDGEMPGVADDFGISLESGRIAFGIGRAAYPNDKTILSNVTVNTGQWVHVAAVRAQGTFFIYINGVYSAGTYESYGLDLDDSPTLTIGRVQNSSVYLNASLDDIRIWNVARSEADIVNNMYTDYPAATPNLVNHFSFDSGSGNTAVDTGIQPTNATITAPLWGARTILKPISAVLWSNGATTNPITVTQPGNYTVAVTNAGGCTVTSQPVAVTVYTPSQVAISGNTTICPGGATTLTASGSVSYTWSPATGLSATTGTMVTATPSATTTYTVTSTDTNGCTAVKSVTVTVDQPQAVIAASSTGFCPGGTVVLTASNASGAALALSNGTNFVIPRTIADDFTIEFWIKTTDPGPGTPYWHLGQGIIDGEVGGVTDDFGISLANGKIAFGLGNGASGQDLTSFSTASVNTGQWVHVAVTRTKSSGAFAIYINGILDSQGVSSNTNSLSASSTLTIGRVQGSGIFLNATLDDIRIWNVVRSQQDILNNIQTAYMAAPQNLLNHYNFNAGSGNIAADTGYSPADNVTITSPNWVMRPVLDNASIVWSNGATTPQITVTEAGSYSVVITNSNGCTVTSQPVQIVAFVPPAVSISPSGNTICAGADTMLTASGAATYTWSPATGFSAATGASVIANPAGTTVYTVTGTSADGCTDTAEITVHVPVVTIEGNPFVCNGEPAMLTATGGVSYSWSPATGLNTTTGATVSASPSEDTTYTVTVTTINGCTATKSVLVKVSGEVLSVQINASGPLAFCTGGQVTLSVPNPSNYSSFLWSNGDTAPSITVSESGSYSVQVVNEGGCLSEPSEPIAVEVINNLQVSFQEITICPGESVELSATGCANYSWQGIGLNASSGATVIATPPYSEYYTVTGITNGCTSQKYIIVNVTDDIYLYPHTAALVCTGDSVELSAYGAESMTWSPATGLNTTLGGTVTASPEATTTYTISGINDAGCPVSKSVTVTVSAPVTPVVEASGPVSLCEGGSVTLSVPDFATSTAISLNTQSYTQVPQTVADDFTIEYWMKTIVPGYSGTQWIDGALIVSGRYSPQANINDYGTSLLGNKLAFGIGNPDKTIVSQSDVATGQWVHVAVTRNKASGVFELYINGTLEASYAGENHNSLNGSGWPFLLIAYSDAGSSFRGQLDELRIWDTVRTPSQIQEGMAATYPVPTPGLVSRYSFNEGAGNLFTDSVTGNTNEIYNPWGSSWIARPVTGDFSNVLWSTGATTGQITVTEPGTYTVTATTPQGCTATSEPVVVSISAGGGLAGTISDAQDICHGAEPSDITVADYSGTIIKWQKSDNEDFTNATDISFTGETLPGSIIGLLSGTTYFRAVTDNACSPNSEHTTITVGAFTTWDGTSWSNGEPTSSIGAIIAGDYTSDGDLFACALVITDDAVVTVSYGDNFYIKGKVTVLSGTLTIENNANLIQVEDVNNEGEITVIKESAPMYRLDYALWSSPVEGQKLKAFSPETLNNRFYSYNPLSDAYATVADPVNTDFAEAKSYLIRVSNTQPGFVSNDIAPVPWEGNFIGIPNNGSVDVPVTGMAGEINGYNGIGNPYPSSINIAAFFAANQNNLAEDTPIYFWRKKNDANTSSYCSLTLAGYNKNAGNAFGDSSNGVFDNPNDSENWAINAGQGFIVQATGSSVTFSNDMRVAVNNGQMFRSAMDASDKSRLWLNLTNSEGAFSQATIAYTPFTTLGRDFGWDGKALADGDIAIYSLAGENKFGIQARPAFNPSDEVPLEYKVTLSGSYTISLDHFDGVFAEGQEIYLRDNLLGVTHSLDNPYGFTTEAGIITGRFDVVYAEALGIKIPEFDPKSIIVYKQGHTINISSGNVDMKSVSISDIRGRLLYLSDDVNASELAITTLQIQEEMLIVRITTVDGTKADKKIIF